LALSILGIFWTTQLNRVEIIQENYLVKNRLLDLLTAAIPLLRVSAPAFAGQPPPAVPEPTTVLLMGGGLGAILAVHYLRSKKR
jgi:hypothetical protein